MPQISCNSFLKSSDSLQCMIWEIIEDLPFFQTFPENWLKHQSSENGVSQKNIESTAARYCLWNLSQLISKGPWDLKKDERNRPFFSESNYHISLSHSYPFVAAVICKGHLIGIDLERYGRNVAKIGPRFLSLEEWNRWQDSHADLTMAWTCKEAIYKAMGVPGLSFQQDIILPNKTNKIFEITVKNKLINIQTESFEKFECSIAKII